MIKVLQVEDDSAHAELMTRYLESPPGKYEVFTACTLAEGRSEIENHVYDVVILDLQLPDGDGRELLSLANARQPRVPVIVLSLLDDQKTMRELLLAGADSFIPKGSLNGAVAWQQQIAIVCGIRDGYRQVLQAQEANDSTHAPSWSASPDGLTAHA